MVKPPVERVKLTAELVEAFAGTFLSPLYDNPQPTPDFHREAWQLYCTEAPMCAIAAPREHAKSTALTHDYALATAMFREQDYIVIVSATEPLAIGHLADIAKELRENDDLIREFGIKCLLTDAKTDIIVDFNDGHQCRFIARGSGQKMRGLKWNGKRPGLIICDDLEEDEQVENVDIRKRFRKWFFRALIPTLRRGGVIRMHGTILHEDALLARVMKQNSWASLLFKAHAGFSDFTDILWPEQFPESRLRMIRKRFIDDNDAAGYSQEYLNDPFDNTDAYLRRDDYIPMDEEDEDAAKIVGVGCDFAVSKKDKANRTSFTVGGKCARNLIHVFDQYIGRWDTLEWIDIMFDIQTRYEPEMFFVEDGVIWKSVAPMVFKEMQIRDIFLNIQPINPIKDKATRGRPLQKHMRAGACRYKTDADWFPEYQEECLRFTGTSDAVADDAFDSTATLVIGFESMAEIEEEDFDEDEDPEARQYSPQYNQGRSQVTGY